MAIKLTKGFFMKSKSMVFVNGVFINMMILGESYAEEINNPYGLSAIIDQGDIIAKIVLVILLVMSLGTWIILIYKYMEQSKNCLVMNVKRFVMSFWEKPNLDEALNSMVAR
jgi:biopolymer transport protein ExbB